MLAARQRERIRHAVDGDRFAPEAREFRVEETHVELGVVDDETRVADESEKIVDDRRKDRLVPQRRRRMAVDAKSVLGHLALGIDERVKHPAGRVLMDDLDPADLDDAMARGGIEAGRLGVEHDFTHRPILSPASRRARASAPRSGPASSLSRPRCR